jgi:hypothetical protein
VLSFNGISLAIVIPHFDTHYSYGEWENEVKPNDQGGECWLIHFIIDKNRGSKLNIKIKRGPTGFPIRDFLIR